MTTSNEQQPFFSPDEIDPNFQAEDFGLSWEEIGPNIQAEVKERKRRRFLWWWLGTGTAVFAILLILFIALADRAASITAFPIPQRVAGSAQQSVQSPSITQTEVTDPATVGSIVPTMITTNSSPTESSQATKGQFFQDVTQDIDPGSVASVPSPVNTVQSLITPRRERSSVEQLPSVPIPFLATFEMAVDLPDPTAAVGAAMPTEKSPVNWLLELNGGISNPSAAPFTGTNPQVQDIPLMGYDRGLQVGKMLGSNWSIHASVNRQTLRWRSNADYSQDVQIYQPNTIDTIFITWPSGQETYAYTDSVAGIRQFQFQQYNQQDSWQLGLLVGYQRDFGRWAVGLQLGPQIQLAADYSGQQLTAENTLVELAPPSTTELMDRLALRQQIDLAYRLGSHYDLGVRLGYQLSFRDAGVNVPYTQVLLRRSF